MKACAVCLSDRVSPALRSKGYQLSRCETCSHLYVSDTVAPADLEAAYGHDYYEPPSSSEALGYADYLGTSARRMRGFSDRLAKLEKHVASRGRLLDYGCAVGLFVKVAADAGWVAAGYDRSDWAADYGRRTWGLNIVVGDGSRDPFEPGSFDAVTMWDVLEHLASPRDVLGSVCRWLKPGGLLALNTVNSSSLGARMAGQHWRHFAPPMHLQYFTRASLERLLLECGFKVIDMQNQGVMLSSAKPIGSARKALTWVENVATHWRAKRLATALNLLDEVDIVALRC